MEDVDFPSFVEWNGDEKVWLVMSHHLLVGGPTSWVSF